MKALLLVLLLSGCCAARPVMEPPPPLFGCEGLEDFGCQDTAIQGSAPPS